MNKLLVILAALATTLAAAGHAAAQHTGSAVDHSKMGHGTAAAPAASGTPSTDAFKAANDRMHAGMAITFTGDADVDFVKGMIPHHQGAVEMAQIVLKYGKDPKLKKLARDIIRAQDKEIAFMKRWLAQTRK